jgi:alpha-amylase
MRRPATLLLALLLAACATPHGPAASAGPAPGPALGAPAIAATPPPATAAGPWWNGAVFYEVFVRSFLDSNGDGKGDLPGLVARLDYLNDGDPRTTSDLGVDALWLMPVFDSPSYHGYDVTDYEKVSPDYGTNADLERLVAEAHRRGMRVIVDLVLNHTSSQHPWFVESASSPTSARRDWYVWRTDDPGWGQPWNSSQSAWHERSGAHYYAIFWSGMPDLNFRTAAVREEAKRIARLWLGRGVDGFRLDAVRHLVETGPGAGQSGNAETHAFLKEFAAAVKAARPDALLVGEVWSNTFDISDYYEPGELDVLFDFPLSTAIVEGLKGGDGAGIGTVLEEVIRTYPRGAVDAPFLTNHDQVRIATQLGSDASKLRLAAAILLTLPGAPFLWQGEELGMQNGPGNDDEWKRTPMPWDGTARAGFTAAARPWFAFAPGHEAANVAAESADPGSLLSRYRDLIRVRHESGALRTGDLSLVRGAPAPLLAYLRRGDGETVLVVHNLGTAEAAVAVPDLAGTTAQALLADPGASLARQGAGWAARLPARATGVWRVR